ncbi:MAG: sarcosine oxidase subunit delta [Sneathiella sp.]|uniref:sarcosine oxidase subunit delta n=1 Tax=Sneathiella sp. TaxID=1964365 RepID=UPI00300280E3
MLRFDCPFCGKRDETEFVYGGDASRTRPDMSTTDMKVWNDYVFLRENPKGPHAEYWFHQQGCRSWLKVNRDVVTNEISDVTFATPDAGDSE